MRTRNRLRFRRLGLAHGALSALWFRADIQAGAVVPGAAARVVAGCLSELAGEAGVGGKQQEMQSHWELVQQEFNCNHPETLVRKKLMVNGKPQYVQQCLRCGQNTGAVKKDTIGIKILSLEAFDESLWEAWNARRLKRLEDLRGQENALWWQRYEEVLASPEWQERRRKVMERDHRLCQACRERPAVQVHHLTYKHLGQEPLFELVAVCTPCHERLHNYEEADP